MSKRTLGILVRQTRQSKGLTQYALAKDAGISTPYLQRLESGEYDTFPPDLLTGVARVLGVAPESLFREMEKGAAPVPAAETGAVETPSVVTPETAPAESQALAPASPGMVAQEGEPLLGLVSPVDPDKLAQDIASLPNDDQALVADFVQLLLRRRGR